MVCAMIFGKIKNEKLELKKKKEDIDNMYQVSGHVTGKGYQADCRKLEVHK